ncbi:RagB/SusD family nutrient uptake outer membrane protein [Flexithrix dorotheae]|uniref:RagB/SusD family nutrient uptake outer membrane protein n=1 Tax=Flexithrix dorotheae TaxID=70993 RepID=UPI0003A9F3A1|nr:RagB/SusD family nutrient uptake outer membrane protein [Flexithrix dorotheae]
MKKLIIIFSIIIGLSFIYSSCNDSFLEKVPLNEASDASFYTKESDAIAAVNSVYDVLQWIRLWKYEITVIGNQYNTDLGIPRPNQFQADFQPTNERRLSMWSYIYTGVNRANLALEKIPAIEMDESLKARLLGEVNFLRGLYYFTLATHFGDVIIRTESTTISNLEMAKSPKSEVIDFVRNELKAAIDVLPERSAQESSDLGRATKGAALALLGKVELYQNNFSEAANYFKQVIDSKEYVLNEEYAPQFMAGGDNTSESIFEVQHVTNAGGWANDSEGSWMSGWNSSTQQGINFGFGMNIQPNESFVSAFEDGDKRKDYIIVEEGEDYFGVPFNSANSITDYGLRKYVIPAELEAGGAGDSGINFHLIRFADVLLMYAEALNEVNNGPTGDAEAAINLVRERAELKELPTGLSKEAFFEAIVKERRIELFLENHRTWDLIRWGLAEQELGEFNGFVAGKHETLPIPQSEIDANSLLVQNPNYQ